MLLYLLVFCCGCVGVMLGLLLGACWWWIKIQLHYRVLRRLAASLNRMADMIEDILERLHNLADEADRSFAECKQRREV